MLHPVVCILCCVTNEKEREKNRGSNPFCFLTSTQLANYGIKSVVITDCWLHKWLDSAPLKGLKRISLNNYRITNKIQQAQDSGSRNFNSSLWTGKKSTAATLRSRKWPSFNTDQCGATAGHTACPQSGH